MTKCTRCGRESKYHTMRLCHIKQLHSHDYYLRKTYKLTLASYDEMLEEQNNKCWICGKTPEENGRRLAVDHNHKTGRIRALLCTNCNVGLGGLGDSPALLARAIEYLELFGHAGNPYLDSGE